MDSSFFKLVQLEDKDIFGANLLNNGFIVVWQQNCAKKYKPEPAAEEEGYPTRCQTSPEMSQQTLCYIIYLLYCALADKTKQNKQQRREKQKMSKQVIFKT